MVFSLACSLSLSFNKNTQALEHPLEWCLNFPYQNNTFRILCFFIWENCVLSPIKFDN